jgi:signal transduction histidine kinase/ActR/RegA family two-component response regulator
METKEPPVNGHEPYEMSTQVVHRESAVTAREDAVLSREDAARLREEAARLREEAARLRETAVAAQEEALQAKRRLEEAMAQTREANERLVIATMEAQAMTEEAERANRIKDEFLATVSHELRTPLNAVLGWARMLAAKQVQGDRAGRALATVERNATLLARLIDDLLDVARATAGTLQVAFHPVSVAEVATAALDSVASMADERSIRIALSNDAGDHDIVSGDAARLQQVIWNLLANAIKFTPEGGHVALSVRHVGPDVEVSVSDTGQGLSPEFLPHVFDRFRQAHGGTSRRHSGLGLGLAIAYQIVEQHGGSVRAESPGLGKGSTFTIRLPLVAPVTAADVPDAPGAHAQDFHRLDGLHILVVEDDADNREFLSVLLERAGAIVIAVASVADALNALTAAHADALVSDIGLPDDDGYALIARLRRRESQLGGFLPAVALTGYTRAEDRARVLAAGFQAHVPKPVDPAELTAAIIAARAA